MWLIACLPYLAGRRFIPFDSIAAFYPTSHFVVSSLVHGMAPWWNPYMFGGQPLLADPQSMIFTPHTLTGLVAGSDYSLHVFDVTTLGCLLVGGLTLHRYGETTTDHWQLPVLGAAIFMFGGVATSRLQHVPEIVSYSWLPVELLLLRNVATSGKSSSAFALEMVLALVVLNANQVVFLSVFGLAPFAILHCATGRRPLRSICLVACAAIVAMIMVSPVLAATWEFLQSSNRPSLPISASVISSLPFHVFASLVVPGLYGVTGPINAAWTPTDITQDYLYVGIIPCAMLVFSVARFRSLTAESKLCLAMMALCFFFAMGTRTPLYRLLFEHVPGFSSFRRPADGAFLLNFFFAVFVAQAPLFGFRIKAGAGLLAALTALVLLAKAIADAWDFAAKSGHVIALASCLQALALRIVLVAAIFALLLLAKPRVRSVAAVVLLTVAFLDLLSAGRFGSIFAPQTSNFEDAELYSGHPDATQGENATGQTIGFLRAHQTLPGGADWRMEALGGNLSAAMPMVFQLAAIQGYDPVLNARYAQLIGSQNLEEKPKHFTDAAPTYDGALYRRLGLRFVLLNRTILKQPEEFGAFGAVSSKLRHDLETGGYAHLVDAPGGYEVWEMRNAMPRATLISASGEVDDKARPPGSCSIVSYEPTEVRVHCRSDKQAQLVLGDNAAPGWFACVNGAQADITVFQGLFRAVPVPEGDSETRFHYQPLPFLRSRNCAS